MVLILATLLVFAGGWIVVFRYRTEHLTTKLAAASPAERRWIPLTTAVISLHVCLAQLLLTLVLVGLAARPLVGARHELLLGIAIFVGGMIWWFWARRALGPIDEFVDTVRPPARLLVDGPFAIVRHPLALGTLLCALGPAVAASSVMTWTSFAASAVCLAKRCVQDEELLCSVFGPAYERYARQTRRLVPFVW